MRCIPVAEMLNRDYTEMGEVTVGQNSRLAQGLQSIVRRVGFVEDYGLEMRQGLRLRWPFLRARRKAKLGEEETKDMCGA